MKSVATSVRITASSNDLLSVLAGKTGKSKAQIVEEALRAWEDRTFWADVQQAFATPESSELRAEHKLWDSLTDGIETETWAPPKRRPQRKRK